MRQAFFIPLVCLLAATAHGASLGVKSGVHSDLCEWGPQYWCSSKVTADRCGKTQHCRDNDWTQDLIRDERCTATQKVVKSVRQTLSTPVKQMSDHDIAVLLAKTCSVEKEMQFRLLCKDLVTDKDVLPKLLKLALSKLPTMSVAIAVGGCRRQGPKETCETECGNVVKTLQLSAGKVMTRDLYMRMFKPICSKTGMAHQVCEAMANENYEKFVKGITSVVPSEVCPKDSTCLKESSVLRGIEGASTECTMCKDVVSEIRTMARSSEVQGAVRSLIKSACTHLGEFKELCDTLADEGLTYVAELIVSEMEPVVICERFGLCKDPESKIVAVPMPVGEKSALKCTLCNLVMGEIDKVIQEDKEQAKVESVLEAFCTQMPDSIKAECKAFVEEYGATIIDLLASELVPGNVCPFLHLCEKEASSLTRPPLPNFEESDDELCQLCEYIVSYIDGLLKENSTKAEIEALLKKVCNELPASLKTECNTLVKNYLPLIEMFFEKGLPPKKACQGVKMCPASVVVDKKLVDSSECDMCLLVVTEFTHILSEKSTKEEIDAALEKVCRVLPDSDRDSCTTIIDTYAPLILQLIAEELEPKEVCTLLKLCPHSKATVKKSSILNVRKNAADLCPICEFVIQQLDGILKENSTEQEIEKALEQVCGFLPATIKTECDSLVEQFTPQLVQLLVSQSPSEVCKLLGLCTSSATLKKSPYLGMRKGDADLCPICEFVIQQLDGILKKNSTEQEIEKALEQVCGFLPATIKTECDSLVEQYTPQLVQLLVAYSPSDVCKLLGLCTSSATLKKSPYLGVRKGDADLCPICEFVIQQLDGILKKNSTEQEIEKALEQVCGFLPATIKTECDSLVEQFTPQLVQLLVSQSPSDVCKLLGLCTSSATLKKSPYLGVRKGDADLCPICEFVIQQLDGILKKNSTEQEIEKALEQVCGFLPATIKTECDSLVEQYTPQLVQLLVAYSPSDVCKLLGLCTSSATLKKSPYLGMRKGDADLCPICEFVIQQLDGILKKNSTEQEIEKALEQVCGFLPATIKTECDSLVEQYTPQLVQLLVAYSPSDVCKLLGLCTSSATLKKSPYLGMRKGDADLCPICEFVIQQLDGILKKNSTEQEIEKALEQVCGFLPATIKTECDSLVEQYTPQLVQLLVAYSPSDVCKLLGLCTSSATVKKSPYLGMRKGDADLCPICEFVIQQLDGILKKNSTEQEIEKALEQVCGFLPATIKTECDSLVEQYTPQLVQLLVAYSPSDVCKLLGLCTSSATLKKSPYLGMRKGDADLCPICEFVIQQLDGILKKNSTEQEIEKALEQVCGFLPATIKTECDSLVEQYTPQLVQLLVAYSPSDVCKLLGLCTSSATLKKSPYLGMRKGDADLCPICEFVIQQLDGILKKNSTEQEIEKALEQVCGFLPATIKTECDSLVEQYTPQLVQLLVAYSPSDVCKLLGLCTSSATVKKSPYLGMRKGDADLCPICEFVIQQLDGILKKNSTEQEIEKALEQVCGFLPATIKTECDSLVEQYTPQLVQLLVAYSPSDVCKLLGLCTSSVKKSSYSGVRKGDADLCPICEFMIQQLDGILKENSTEQEIEKALEQVCGFLPATIKTECDSLVEQFTPQLVQLLVSQSPSEVCKLLGLCTSSAAVKKSSYSGVRKGDADLCPICEFMIQQLDGILKENSTEQEIEKALEQVCGFLPATIKTECDSLVEQFTPQLVQLLVSQSPSEVCKLLGLCTSSVGLRKETADLCPICELVVKQLDGFLKENSTEQEIEKALEEVCAILPASIKAECDTLVKQYTPQLVQLLVSYSPSDVCKLLGLCTGQVGTRKEMADLCPICELVVQQLDGFLKQNSTEQEIEKALEEVCDILPGNLKTECDLLVKQFTPQLVQLLLAYAPSDVCKLLGLCKSARTEVWLPVPSTLAEKADPLCALCELAMTKLDNILKENSTEQEIEAALDIVCQILPETIRKECDQLVQQYTPFIVQLLVANLQPKQVCTALALCPMANRHIDALAVARITKQVDVKKGELCPLCTYVFTTIDNMLDSNATKQDAIAALDKVCEILPSAIKDQCEPFVTLYAPYVLDLIVQKFSPSYICQHLSLCTSTATIESEKSTALVKKTVGESELCSLCQYVLQYLDTILANNSTEAEIESALEMVCSIVPESLKDQCDALIKMWTPQLIAYLINEVQPKEICVGIGFCNAHVEVQKSELTATLNADTCEICETVLSFLDGMLKDNSTQEEILDALTKVCDIVPGSIKADCNKYIQQYFHEIVNLLLDFPPSELCRIFNLCPATKEFKEVVEVNGVKTDGCEICEMVLSFLDSTLKDNATQEEIVDALTEVCDIMPGSMKAECDKYIKKYFHEIVNLLLDFPPSEICKHLSLCASTEEASGVTCELCELVISHLKSLISSTSTEDEIETALEKVCVLLPASLKTECDNLVESYTPSIIKLLLQELAPRQVCIELGICSNADAPKAMKMVTINKQPLKVKDTECELCTTVMSELESMLSDKSTQDEIRNALDFVCTRVLPQSLSDECVTLVDTYEPLIIQFLTQEYSPKDICVLLQLCKAGNPSQLQQTPVASNALCPLCEYVAQTLDTMLLDNSTQKEIEQAMEKVCTLLPSTIRPECVSFIDVFTPQIVDFLVQEMNPSVICKQLKLCDSGLTKTTAPKAMKMVTINKQALKVKDTECELCTTVMSELESMLSDKSTQGEIRNALDFVCTRVLPQSLSDECVTLVDTYEPLIIQFLTQEYSPKDICVLLQLCKAAPKATKMVTINKQPLKVKDTECELCTTVMSELESMLSDKSTQDEIRNALDFVCTRVLPQSLSDECVTLVDTYEPLIIQFLTQEYSPKDICVLLQLCKPSSMKSALVMTKSNNVLTCDLCEMVINKLKSEVSSKTSEAEIEAELKKVCGYLPESIKSECESLVDTYGSLIIELVLKDMSAEEICQKIGLCSSTVQALVMTKSNNVLTCDLCEMVINKLKSEVSSKTSEAEIEAELKKVCGYLPESIKSECESLVDTYASLIIELVLKDMSAEEICQKIGLCSSTVKALVMTKSNNVLTCDLCEMVINKLKSEVSSKTSEAEIEAELKKVCGYLPESIKSECESLVDTYASLIIELVLKDMSAEEICQKIGLCSSTVKVSSETKQEAGVQGASCVLCELVMNTLKKKISSKTVETEIRSILKDVCTLIPETLRQECNTLVDDYTQTIIDLILNGVSADKMCKELHLCPSSLKIRTDVANVEGCTLCEFALEEVKGFVEKKSTVMELTEALKYVCHELPQELSAACTDLAIMFGPNLVDFLAGKIAPKRMCQLAELCPPPKPSNVQAAVEVRRPPVEVRQPPKSLLFMSEKQEPLPLATPAVMPDCSACKFALYDVQTALSTPFWRRQRQKNTNDSESPKIVNLLCDKINMWPDVCRFMVIENLPKLINDAQGFRFPIQFCQDLKLCEPPKPAIPVANLSPKKRCNLCSRLVQYMGYSNVRGSMDAESVCGFLVPEEQKLHCLSLVENYGSLLMGLLKTHENPMSVCQTVNVCPKKPGPKPSVMKFQTGY